MLYEIHLADQPDNSGISMHCSGIKGSCHFVVCLSDESYQQVTP